MKYGELVEFIENKMAMSHVYQPLLIRSLVDAGGTATLRQLALSFLNQDESQIIYYQKRIKEMPLRILKIKSVKNLNFPCLMSKKLLKFKKTHPTKSNPKYV